MDLDYQNKKKVAVTDEYKEIKRDMDLKNKGITWEYYPREKYSGLVVTPQNRRELILQKGRDYKEKNPDATAAQCVAYGKDFVRSEKKHFKAYLRGDQFFMWKGTKLPVMTEARLTRFQNYAKELEAKWEGMSDEEKEKWMLPVGEEEE